MSSFTPFLFYPKSMSREYRKDFPWATAAMIYFDQIGPVQWELLSTLGRTTSFQPPPKHTSDSSHVLLPLWSTFTQVRFLPIIKGGTCIAGVSFLLGFFCSSSVIWEPGLTLSLCGFSVIPYLFSRLSEKSESMPAGKEKKKKKMPLQPCSHRRNLHLCNFPNDYSEVRLH